jgi:outer membrane protein assembly factor BamE (lipoprotein component of BamABCDE complex)
MDTRTARRSAQLISFGACVLVLCAGTGCGPGALVAMTLAGSAAAVSGEPQRLYGTQGQDFDEQRIALIRSGVHTPADVLNIMGNPQTKVFTNNGEEWSYRYYVPSTTLRSGLEKILTVRFREGKVDDVRYTVTAL